MHRNPRVALSAAVLAIGAMMLGQPAAAAGVKAGILSCNVDSGWSFVFGSTRSLNCTYSPKPGVAEHYVGKISKFGVDIGYLKSAIIVWAVVAPGADVSAGALAGDYGGVTADASVGMGAGANVLVGGSNKSIALQPVSIEGNSGLNVAAGIAEISLTYQP